MSFAYPLILVLLVIPVALIAWAILINWKLPFLGNQVVLPFDEGVQSRGTRWGVAVSLAECLPALILAVVILLLAGPRQLSDPKTKRIMTNIEFCVDISGSMTASFGDEGTRYDGSMKAINDFLDYRQGDAFGLTFFGTNFLHWVPLTSDTSAVRCSPPFMRPESVPSWFGGTMIRKALVACKNKLLEREEGDRMIILVSDGYSSDLSGGADETIAKTLRENNIAVYAIHIAESEIPDPIVNICSLTGGQAFAPDDPNTLKTIFEQIDKMAETRLEKTTAETMDDFAPASQHGIVLLGMSLLSLFGLRYTPW